MSRKSAGILLYRMKKDEPEFFLVHPGGPFWKNKDAGAWSIPKGEFDDEEDALKAAQREFFEETGKTIGGNFIPLKPVKQKGGKTIHAWAMKGDIDAEAINSNTFELEWPPRSGKKQSFPEIDRAAWFDLETAKLKINESQYALIEEIVQEIKQI